MTTDVCLSWARGRPIAQEEKGAHRTMHVFDGKADKEQLAHPMVLLGEDFFRALRTDEGAKLSLESLEELLEALKLGAAPEEEYDITTAYDTAKHALEGLEQREVKLTTSMVTPVPNFEAERETCYIAGPSGSGKSTYVAGLCRAWLKLQPTKVIHLFSRVQDDPAFADFTMTRHKIGEELMTSAAPAFDDAIVIFDDIDTVTPPTLADFLQRMRDDLLETGRHRRTTVITTSHQIANYSKTRTVLLEASSVTLFPQTGSAYHLKDYLKRYAGCGPKTIARILALPSRWITHSRTAPQYILYETGCFLLHGTE